MDLITVACVFQASAPNGPAGGCYNAFWVQKLKKNVALHLSLPHRFVCLTNTLVPGVECIPLKYPSWDGWWSKIELFEPGLFNGPVLYMDLDILAIGSLDDFVRPHPNLVMLRDYLSHIKNSSIMFWDGRDVRMHSIFHAFKADPGKAKALHQHTDSLGDQGFIQTILEKQGHKIDLWQDILGPKGFVHFSVDGMLNPSLENGSLPMDTKLLYCLGYPKFHQYVQMDFVQEHWI